jgi:Rap1a immunity proteins
VRSASAFEQEQGDVDFKFGGPSGEALEIACQSNNTKDLVCDYTLKGFIDGMMFQEDKDVCKRQSFDDGFKWAICLNNYDTAFEHGKLTGSMYDKVCLPETITFSKEKHIVTKYFADHQNILLMPAVYLTYLALSEAFPCSHLGHP